VYYVEDSGASPYGPRGSAAAFPTATLRVRLDGGFATPALFTFLEAQPVEYLVAMASNERLEFQAVGLTEAARS